MPVITFANSKGGSGKTTSTLILAGELSQKHETIIIDADPRRPITKWAKNASGLRNIEVWTSEGENSIQDEIAKAAETVPFVLVDLEGMASQLAMFAMIESDLVIVPAREYEQDAEAALDTLQAVKRAGRATRSTIPAAVLITQARAAVKSRTARHVNYELRSNSDIKVFGPELIERDAFACVYSTGTTLRDLDRKIVNGVDKAIKNAEAFSGAVIEELKKTQKGRAA